MGMDTHPPDVNPQIRITSDSDHTLPPPPNNIQAATLSTLISQAKSFSGLIQGKVPYFNVYVFLNQLTRKTMERFLLGS